MVFNNRPLKRACRKVLTIGDEMNYNKYGLLLERKVIIYGNSKETL